MDYFYYLKGFGLVWFGLVWCGLAHMSLHTELHRPRSHVGAIESLCPKFHWRRFSGKFFTWVGQMCGLSGQEGLVGWVGCGKTWK